MVASLALPDDKDAPAKIAEDTEYVTVARDIRSELFLPEAGTRCGRCSTEPAAMAMPETAVYEQHHPASRKHDIRPARQILSVKSEAVAHRVEKAPDDQLWAGVPPLDRPHVAGALFRGQHVGHDSRHNRLRLLQKVGHIVYPEFPIGRVVFVELLRDNQ